MNAPVLPIHDGSITIAELIDLYMAQYAGRDRSIVQRLGWWRGHVGAMRIDVVSDDDLHAALEGLASRAARYYSGKDLEGWSIFKPRRKRMAGSTINRYSSAIASIFTWAIRRRIAPKGFDNPVRRLEHEKESLGKLRFLSDEERARLLLACKASKWPRLYLLVLLGLTTGARKGELLGLRWQDESFPIVIKPLQAHTSIGKDCDAELSAYARSRT